MLLKKDEVKIKMDFGFCRIMHEDWNRQERQEFRAMNPSNKNRYTLEQKIYDILNYEPVHIDKISINTNIEITEIMVKLLNMEMHDIVNDKDEVVGTATRQEVYENGHNHRCQP